MHSMVRTTITLPSELLERLRTAAFHQKKTLSDLIREGAGKVVDYKKSTPGSAIAKLVVKYSVRGKKGSFSRKDFYDQLIRKNVPS